MTLYDSSVLVDYLNGVEETVAYIESHYDERTITIPLVLFELYQGEVFRSGPAEFDALDGALDWLTVVEATADLARSADELQDALHRRGEALSARDAFVAGAAKGLDERLVVADSDFDAEGITDELDVEFV